MPLDINMFRVDRGGDPETIRDSQRHRFAPPEMVDEIIDLDTRWRGCRSRIDYLNKDRNRFQKEVAKAKKAGGEDPENAAKILEVVKEVKIVEAELADLGAQVAKLLPKIGNIVAPDVPVSDDEEKDNVVVSTYGPNPTGDHYMHHHEVLHRIGGYEPERGVGVAGHRAYFLRDYGLLLNQALINYGLAFLRKRGYSVLQPPFFMSKDVMAGVAQLEQFDEELYKVTGEGTDEKYLIATSEQPMCAFHKDEWLKESELPLRYGGLSTCFRKEAGKHGKDTWGIFRVHQFEKVEQFVICEGDLEKSSAMQDEMSKAAEEFYQSLGISYRVVNIVSGELNNAAIKKYDLEAWFPAYQEFRELVSCSNCTDYQSRAMEVRSGQKKTGQAEKKYVHMLNATLCATTRTLSCILENYQTDTGVTVPEVLVPYMGGITFLEYVKDLPKGKRETRGSSKGGQTKNAAPVPVVGANGAAAPEADSSSRALPTPPAEDSEEASLANKIPSKRRAYRQGGEIRELKKSKPDKAAVQPDFDELLALSPVVPKAKTDAKTSNTDPAVAELEAKMAAKGVEIRDLKDKSVDKATLQPHIEELLAMKAQHRQLTGAVDTRAPEAEGSNVEELRAQIVKKGEEIRELKKSKPSKEEVKPHIDVLVGLKAKFQELTGEAYAPKPNGIPASAPAPQAPKKASKNQGNKTAPAPAPSAKESNREKKESKTRALPPPPKVPGPVLGQDGKANLENLAQHLVGFSYVAGWQPGKSDASMFELLAGNPAARAVPPVARWLRHMVSYTPSERKAWED